MELNKGPKVRRTLVKPILNLFSGEPNTKQFKVKLDDLLKSSSSGSSYMTVHDIIVRAALNNNISDEILDKV